MPSNGTPIDDAMLRIRALEGERERLKATVEDQRKMILSWQREAAPGGNIMNRIVELEAEVEYLRNQLAEWQERCYTYARIIDRNLAWADRPETEETDDEANG